MTDIELMDNVKEGQVEKLAVLFERHHVSLYNFFLRLQAAETSAKTLCRMFSTAF